MTNKELYERYRKMISKERDINNQVALTAREMINSFEDFKRHAKCMGYSLS